MIFRTYTTCIHIYVLYALYGAHYSSFMLQATAVFLCPVVSQHIHRNVLGGYKIYTQYLWLG